MKTVSVNGKVVSDGIAVNGTGTEENTQNPSFRLTIGKGQIVQSEIYVAAELVNELRAVNAEVRLVDGLRLVPPEKECTIKHSDEAVLVYWNLPQYWSIGPGGNNHYCLDLFCPVNNCVEGVPAEALAILEPEQFLTAQPYPLYREEGLGELKLANIGGELVFIK